MTAGRPPHAGRRRPRRGQALIEMAFVVVMLVFLAGGIIEFGRAFMIANMITHAARDGARVAAALPSSQRDAGGCYTTAAENRVVDHVRDLIETVMATNGDFGDVQVAQGSDGPVPVVTVTITGTVDYLILPGMLGDSFAVSRRMVYRDEGRTPGQAC